MVNNPLYIKETVNQPFHGEKIDKNPYAVNMGFWDNVITELDYRGMTNKALAEKAGFDASNIGRGIRLKSSPSADTAVKIAQVLNVSVEYLVTGKDSRYADPIVLQNISKLHKYADTLAKLDMLPEKSRNSIVKLIDDVSDDCARR